MTQSLAIHIQQMFHLYNNPLRRFALFIPELQIPNASLLSILGPSGSGKSTLLSLASLIQTPSKDYRTKTFRIFEHDVASLIRENQFQELERIRRTLMGFYLQGGELLSNLTLRENVAMPLRLNGMSSRQANDRADYLLSFLLGPNAKSILSKLAGDCSGGEAQRVAIARALAHQPKVVFVDEPTSNLDSPNKRRVLDLMVSLVRQEAMTVVTITHDQELALDYSDYVVSMKADPEGWGNLLDHEFRSIDGFGRPASFAAKIDGKWLETNPDFEPITSQEILCKGDSQNAA